MKYIDGPRPINDYNRIFMNGKGSYDRISKFIKTIKQETNINIRYEATYTDYHYQQKITKKNLTTFFNEEFGLKGTITDELNIKTNTNQGYWEILQKESLSVMDLQNLPEGFWSILSSIVNSTPKEMCQIYRKIIAISTDGNIYPCHMNTGKSHLSLGNISTENIFNSPDRYEDKFPLLFNIHDKKKLCKDCWAQNICGGCTMKWFYDENLDNYLMQPHRTLCQSNKKHIEMILLLIAHIRKKPEKWDAFLNHIKKQDKTVPIS